MGKKAEKYEQKTAVALQYDHQNAPYVSAKGVGKVAEKIIETAQEHDIHIEEDPLLAQALSAVPLEEEIPEELYKAVAAVLRFVLYTRDKNK